MQKTLILFLFLISISVFYAQTGSLNRQIRNLTAFNKLYGYVRHFHPSDEAQEIDWEQFASYGSGKVINANDDKELTNILYDLFIPVAPTLELYSTKQDQVYDWSKLVPPDTTGYRQTCWQYKGYQNKPESYYQSHRTYRPFRIPKKHRDDYIVAFITLVTDKLSSIPQAMRLSFSIRKAAGDTLKYEIYGVCGQVNQADSLLTDDWEHKSFVFNDITTDNPAMWIYLGNIAKVQIDSIKCEALINNEYKQIYYNDFTTSMPGAMPNGLKVNINPFNGQAPDNDTYVENINGNNVLSIQKSTTDLPYTWGYFTKLFDEEVPAKTFMNKPLVKGLSCLLPLSLYCSTAQTYPPADKNKLKQLKDNLALIDTHDRTNHNNYLAALMIYWNELQHFFPYWQYAETDWSKDFEKALRQTLQCKNLTDFVFIMCELASQTKDSHATFFDDKLDRKMPGFNAEPIEGKWIVTAVADTSLAIPSGSELIRFNHKPIAQYINKYRKYYVSGTLQNTDKYLFIRAMRSFQDSIAQFTFKTPDNKKLTQNATFGLYTVAGWYNREGKFSKLSDSIYYVNLGTKGVNSDELDSLMTELTQAQGIIFDLRDYPQRTNILNYLLAKPDMTLSGYVKRSIYPDNSFLSYHGSQSDEWNLQPKEPHITAKCVFLCGGYSVSYCESVLMEIKYNKLGTIIGQPTAGVTGNIVMGTYPCDLGAWWTGMFVHNPDGSRFHGVGIIPDIIVPRTIEAVVQGKDSELEAALEFLSKD